MFLVVELARPEIELQPKQVPLPIRHDEVPAAADGVGDELHDVGGNGDARVPQREEHVDGGADGAQEQTDRPGADGVRG